MLVCQGLSHACHFKSNPTDAFGTYSCARSWVDPIRPPPVATAVCLKGVRAPLGFEALYIAGASCCSSGKGCQAAVSLGTSHGCSWQSTSSLCRPELHRWTVKRKCYACSSGSNACPYASSTRDRDISMASSTSGVTVSATTTTAPIARPHHAIAESFGGSQDHTEEDSMVGFVDDRIGPMHHTGLSHCPALLWWCLAWLALPVMRLLKASTQPSPTAAGLGQLPPQCSLTLAFKPIRWGSHMLRGVL